MLEVFTYLNVELPVLNYLSLTFDGLGVNSDL